MKELLVSSPFKANPSLGIWAKVELMGHRCLFGFVTEVEAYGARMLRVDVPHANPEQKAPVFTQVYGGGALFCLTPMAEEDVRRNASYFTRNLVVPAGPSLGYDAAGDEQPLDLDEPLDVEVPEDLDEALEPDLPDNEPIPEDYYHAR